MSRIRKLWEHRDKKFWIKRGTAMVVLVAMVATCVQSAIVNNTWDVVNAADDGAAIISLSAIEELKETIQSSEDQTFTIVEVVPAIGTGTMGYWVPGAEPLTYYNTSTSSSVSFIEEYDLDTAASSVARETEANKVTTDLTSLGLLSAATTGSTESSTALTTAAYAEYIEGIATDIPEEAVPIKLVDADGNTRTEQITLTGGSFVYQANKTGSFNIVTSDVKLDSTNGTYVQDVEKFVYGTKADETIAAGTDAFYYTVTFKEVDLSNLGEAGDSDSYDGIAIYTENTENSGRYDYEGTLGVDDFSIELKDEMTYYTVETTTVSAPSATDDDAVNTYLAVGEFVPASDGETGYFTAESAYVYVGENQGNYSYNADGSGTDTITIEYSQVYVNIGFTNNNWVRQHVLDDDTAEFVDAFKIQVEEVLPSELTSEKIAEADLLVFSAGFSLSATDESDTLVSLYSTTNDVTQAIRDEIVNSVQDGAYTNMTTPIIIDGNLQGSTLNNATAYLKQVVNKCGIALAGTAAKASTNGSAQGGLYYIAKGAALVTRNIIAEIATGTSYYSEVSATIAYENFLRLTTNVDQIEGAAAQINIATSIRHILMVGNQIKETQKTEIRVLEIQPANSASTKDSESDEDIVTTTKLRTWFSGITSDTDIIIDQMSTSEFIGKIDDITEVYDVIYIGADFGNLNTTGSGTSQKVNYNDDAMDGLFYTNIGDTYTLKLDSTDSYNNSYRFVGLLNSDYAADADGNGVLIQDSLDSYYALDSAIDTTYRFSGNDITTSKLEELETFVSTGLPVIISDSLIDTNSTDDYADDKIRTDRVDKTSYMYDFLNEAIGEPNVFTASEAAANSTVANQYLNLSKPEIVFATDAAGNVTGTPTEYTGISDINDDTLVKDNTVTYTFTITNATDPTPEDTVYSVSLYIDQDADGNHEDSEQISELTVTDEDENTVSEDELKADIEYTVVKELPSTYQGSIPWKLEVSIVGREEFHTSETGYTYIQPTSAIEIKILHIHETGNQAIDDNTTYLKYINALREAGIYDIQIDEITITNLNNNTSINSKTNTYTTNDPTAEAIYNDILDNYDMLVLGFGDGYGIYDDNGGLDAEAAEAVAMYIDSGKAVLFAHDTTSTNNVPANASDTTYPVSDSGGDTAGETGYTYMVWKKSENQHEGVGFPAWSLKENNSGNTPTWEDVQNNYDVISTNGEIYNYEIGEWGYWVAPDDCTVTPVTYTELNELCELSPLEATSGDFYCESDNVLPYWNATIDGGTWGYYAFNQELLWFTVDEANQPSIDTDNQTEVCYIYYNGAWGWYEISTKTTTTSDSPIEWVELNEYEYYSNNNYGYYYYNNSENKSVYSNYIYYNNNQTSWYRCYYKNSNSSGNVNKLTDVKSYEIYNYQYDEWGYWQVADGYEAEKSDYMGYSYTGSATSSYYPYWNSSTSKYGYYTTTINNNKVTSGPTFSAVGSSVVIPANTYYIYKDGVWDWYEIKPTSTTDPVELELNEYTYTTSTTTTTTSNYSVFWYTSYYFNTVLRDYIGIDRYGITNTDYNTNYMYPYAYETDEDGTSILAQDEALVANGYVYQYTDETTDAVVGETMTEADEQALLDAGYSIAYAPTTDSSTWEYVEQTQGYTIGCLVENTYGSSSDLQPATNTINRYNTRTTAITQVNQGQITTYPYNINTSEFDELASSSSITVSETHHQYYQLNMNSDDIVVWYCLGGAYETAYPNDVTNFYYIYNMGNVTYTGAGHSDAYYDTAIKVTAVEAQLFINTMIAAYRAGRVDPDVAFVDSSGTTIESLYFTMEEAADSTSASDTLLVQQEGVAGSEAEIEFTVTDTNLENPESRTISLYYYDEDGKRVVIEDIQIYDSEGNAVVNGTLSGYTQYTLLIPDSMLELLAVSGTTDVTLYISITSTFSDGEVMSSYDNASSYGNDDNPSITLYKLGLQQLN